MKRAVRTGPGMDRPPQACADATAYLSPATPSFPAILVHKMDCQQQQPTRPEEGTRHKFQSSPPHLTESNLRRRRQTSLNSHHRHQIASSLPPPTIHEGFGRRDDRVHGDHRRRIVLDRRVRLLPPRPPETAIDRPGKLHASHGSLRILRSLVSLVGRAGRAAAPVIGRQIRSQVRWVAVHRDSHHRTSMIHDDD
ncbi:hypothetical protein B296_00013432 [Ensete ventricosum]|uniref:Uncharacterized protein n=1 Tax=Ensete ventricosum TaxID=4639 RepID=A0A426ZGS8_ENSVE|nr:hypothetical protein B296_00013432 [Ensete ventricosum]